MATLRDIAKRCGVSHMTVSRVLNRPESVDPETRARVMAAVEALDYRPNAMAQGLAGKRTQMIGVVFATEGAATARANDYQWTLIRSIVEAADRQFQDVALLTHRAWRDRQRTRALHHGGHCDGLILVAPHVDSDFIGTLSRARFPFVVVSDWIADPTVSCVDIDNFAAARLGMEHLIAQGHERIAIVHLSRIVGCNQPRIDGCRRALEDHGLTLPPEWLIKGVMPEWGTEEYRDAMRPVFSAPAGVRPTALCCFGDEFALYGIELLTELGLRVPEDVSVLGFNDVPTAAFARPPLTTIRQPIPEIAARAVDLLIAQIHQGQAPGRKEIFPHELVVRKSVRPIPHP